MDRDMPGTFLSQLFDFKFIFSFSFLYGPWNHVKHLFSKERVPFTVVYLLSLSGKDTTTCSFLHYAALFKIIIYKLPVHFFIAPRSSEFLFCKLLMLHVGHYKFYNKKNAIINK